MSHIHWVARQNKLEILRDKDEVNKLEIHEYDGRTHDPDTKVSPLKPKSTRKAESLVRTSSTIVSCREEDAALRKWPLPRYCCASCILETKIKSEAPLRPSLQLYYYYICLTPAIRFFPLFFFSSLFEDERAKTWREG
jgi:hypothetical protein